jgi:site-specific recombinase XerD
MSDEANNFQHREPEFDGIERAGLVGTEATITEAIQAFLSDLGAGHSPATVRTYQVGLSRFLVYLSTQAGIDPAKTLVKELKPDWAVGCVRWISQGQPEANSKTASDKANNTAIKGKDKASNQSKTSAERTPKTTTATYIAGLSRFYKWCALERLLVLPSDEYERMTVRFKDLRGKIQRTILDKVPADEVLDKLLQVAYAPTPAAADSPVKATASSTGVTSASAQINPSSPGQKLERNNKATPGKLNYPSAETVANEEEVIPRRGFRGNASKIAEQDKRRHELIRLRNIALLETLKSTGARVSEICNLKRGDLDNTNRRARVVGKGSKERWIYFSQTAWNALQEYFTTRSRMMNLALDESLMVEAAANEGSENDTTATTRTGKGRRSSAGRSSRARVGELAVQPVFASHHRGSGWKRVKPLSTDAVRKILWGLVEEAELEAHITPHKFRHWFATRMLSATGDLAATQDLLGHANPATTRIYAQVSEISKQQLHRQVFDN